MMSLSRPQGHRARCSTHSGSSCSPTGAPFYLRVHGRPLRRLDIHHRSRLHQECCAAIETHREPLDPLAWDCELCLGARPPHAAAAHVRAGRLAGSPSWARQCECGSSRARILLPRRRLLRRLIARDVWTNQDGARSPWRRQPDAAVRFADSADRFPRLHCRTPSGVIDSGVNLGASSRSGTSRTRRSTCTTASRPPSYPHRRADGTRRYESARNPRGARRRPGVAARPPRPGVHHSSMIDCPAENPVRVLAVSVVGRGGAL
jgi:hypothetical protein